MRVEQARAAGRVQKHLVAREWAEAERAAGERQVAARLQALGRQHIWDARRSSLQAQDGAGQIERRRADVRQFERELAACVVPAVSLMSRLPSGVVGGNVAGRKA